MTVGISSANLATKWLTVLSGTSFTGLAAFYIKLHIGDPGASGASNASSVTTRVVMTFAAPSAGSMAANGTLPSWAAWAGTNGEVVSHISCWDAITTGNFIGSCALTASKTVNTGDTLSLSSFSVSLTPIAA